MPWTIEQLTFRRRGLDFFKEMKGTWRFDSELPRKHLRVFNFTEISPRNCQESRRSSSDGSIVKVPSSKTWNMKPSEATRCKSISLAFMRILIILASEASRKRSNKQGDVICLKQKNNNSNFDDWLSFFLDDPWWPQSTNCESPACGTCGCAVAPLPPIAAVLPGQLYVWCGKPHKQPLFCA